MLALVGGVAAVVALFYLAEALRYPRGSLAQPGAGLYPLLVGALLLASAGGTAIEALRMHSGGLVDWPAADATRRLAAVLFASLAYLILLPLLGHVGAATLLIWVVLHVMGTRPWPVGLGVAFAIALASFFLFQNVFDVPLPAGPWAG